MTITTEEIYNKVSEHLLSMKNQSVDEKDDCVYRGPNGSKCAIGCLIKDEFYSKDLETKSIDLHGRIKEAVEKSIARKLTNNETRMLAALQALHDQNMYWITDDGLKWQGKDRLLEIKENYVTNNTETNL